MSEYMKDDNAFADFDDFSNATPEEMEIEQR